MNKIPDFIEPITAYRLFFTNSRGIGLISPIREIPLTIGKIETAICVPDSIRWNSGYISQDHEIPEINCTCGFYGFKTRKQVMNYFHYLLSIQFIRNGKKPVLFLAKVHFSGKIIEHEIGYRAERMEIIWIKEVKKSKAYNKKE